jgi:ABC-type tungstate transport system substrate-binding protein
MVGGNIADLTDVLTTAISRYTQIGDFGYAIALGIFLMAIIFLINTLIIVARKAKWLYTIWRVPQ